MKKIYALIIAKGESKRLYNKNKRDFNGKPMFVWNLEKCNKLFEKVFVSSEDKEILEIAKSYGAIPIKRPEKLCEGPNIPVYQHAQRKMKADIIVAVQANSPTINIMTIAEVNILMVAGFHETMTSHENGKIYGSVWAMTKDRLKHYPDPYNPKPERLIIDTSIDIHTLEDLENAKQSSQN